MLDVPFKRVLHLIALVPLASPPFAIGAALVVLFGADGMLGQAVAGLSYDIRGLDGLVLSLALSSFPVVYLVLLGALQRLDPSLEEAARSSA